MKTKLDKIIEKENSKLKITGIGYNRIINNGKMMHTVTLNIRGEIPAIGVGYKKICKMLKEYAGKLY